MSEDRLKRLLYRSIYTGTKELDLVLGGFARAHLANLDAGQLDRFEALVDRDDPAMYQWIIGQEPPPPEFANDVLGLIQDHAQRMGLR